LPSGNGERSEPCATTCCPKAASAPGGRGGNIADVENGSEGRSIEVRYAGVVVGRSTKVRDWDTAGAFIGFAEPLPSGTSLVLRGDGVDQPARVVEVFESADPAIAGMQVKFIGAAEAARPASRPAAAAARPAPEPARVPAIVTAPSATAPVERLPIAAPEASPAEASDPASSAATGEQGDGETGQAEQGGQAGSGGKRRRRRR
jgi:hypothetical protein